MGVGNLEARGGWQNHQDQRPMTSSSIIDLTSTYTVYCNLKKELCRFVYYIQTVYIYLSYVQIMFQRDI